MDKNIIPKKMETAEDFITEALKLVPARTRVVVYDLIMRAALALSDKAYDRGKESGRTAAAAAAASEGGLSTASKCRIIRDQFATNLRHAKCIVDVCDGKMTEEELLYEFPNKKPVTFG